MTLQTDDPDSATQVVPAPRKSSVFTRGRPFAKGNPGRPIGALNRATVLAQSLLAGEAEAMMRAAIDGALAGDTSALRLCLDRLVPLRRERTITVDLPPVETAADAVAALTQVGAFMGAGELTPSEGQALAAFIQTQMRAIDAASLERRVAAVEAKMATMPHG